MLRCDGLTCIRAVCFFSQSELLFPSMPPTAAALVESALPAAAAMPLALPPAESRAVSSRVMSQASPCRFFSSIRSLM